MGGQLDLFPESCPHHGPGNVCNLCPEHHDTDGYGFPHRQVCAGRVPLKQCKRCGMLVGRENWRVAEWCCKQCVGLGVGKG